LRCASIGAAVNWLIVAGIVVIVFADMILPLS